MRLPVAAMRMLAGAIVALLIAIPVASLAADHPLRGVALVIGEGAYDSLPKLANPPSDARALDRLLDDLGFDVTRVLDADGQKLRDRLERFAEDAADADVALVYYSGHGIEAGGENFLVPTDADISSPKAAGESLLPLSGLLDELRAKVPVTIVLLDACRTSPYPAGQAIELPGSGEMVAVAPAGLAATRGPTPLGTASPADPDSLGMVIGFAAEPGQAALDGAPGENSPYAAALIKHIAAGGYSFADIMTMVTEEVYLKTKAQQLPWTNSSLRRVLSFGQPAQDEPTGDEALIRDGRRQLLLSIASAPETTRHYVETVAGSEGVPLDALYGMLKVLGVDTSTGEADLEKQLADGAKQLKTFMSQQPAAIRSDPELMHLTGLADEAQNEGAIDVALKFRQQATERARTLSKALDQDEADLKAARLQIGATYAANAQTAVLNFDYQTAAQLFGEAFDEVAKWDDELALNYKWNEGDALRAHGDFKADNEALAAAVTALQLAQTFAPKDKNPAGWAGIENDMGWALYTLGSRESDTAHLEQAVEAFQLALASHSRADDSLGWAIAQMNLGNTLSQLGQRDGDSKRLEQAAVTLGEALDATPRASQPYQWGMIEYNISAVLRLLGERDADTARLDQAVAAARLALEELTEDRVPLDWAQVQNNLGTTLYAVGVRRHDAGLLRQSAAAFEAALTQRTEERVPLDWAMSQSNLANTLVGLADEENDPRRLQQAVDAYRQSLRQLTREKVPLLWATAQSNLGVTLTTLGEATGEAANFTAAADAFRQSLEARPREIDAFNWAMTEFNLAGTLLDLGRGEPGIDSLRESEAATRAALSEWTRERVPLNWAKAQFNLGLVLAAIGDREDGTEALTQSVAAYRAALGEFTRKGSPLEWQTTQNDLAVALQSLGERESGTGSLKGAVEAYRTSLLASNAARAPVDLAQTQFNLGLTLQTLDARGEAGALEQALDAYREALLGYKRDVAPDDWADTQLNIAIALYTMGSRATDNTQLEAAVATYALALEGYSRTARPDDWARVKFNFGVALNTLGARRSGVEEITAAIGNYNEALEVATKAHAPTQWANIQGYLGMAQALLGQRTGDRALVEAGRLAEQASWDEYKAEGYDFDKDFAARMAMFDGLLAELDAAK